MTKTIALSQGKVALVDGEDFERLNQHKWHFMAGGDGYAARCEGHSKQIYMHREIMDALPNQWVDHINMNGLDNRRANLRFCTRSQNHANSRKKPGTSSRYKGVRRAKNRTKWRAGISIDGKWTELGTFETEIEGGRVYNHFALKHFGEFARLNEIERQTQPAGE